MSAAWPRVRLGEVLREEREPVGVFDGGGLPVLGVTNVDGVTRTGVEASDDKSKYLRLRPGRFVYNPYRINVGSIGLSSENQDGIVSPAYVVFAPTELIDAKYLFHYLKSSRGDQLINFHGNRGSVRSALRFGDLCQIEIPLPPRAEQQRIVARIKELAMDMAAARHLDQKLSSDIDVLQSKILDQAFLPHMNLTVPLGEVFRVTTGGTPSRTNSAYWDGEKNWVSSGEVAFRRITQTHERITDLGVRESNAKIYEPGTVLLAMIGQGKTRGQCAILDCYAATNQNVAGIHVSKTIHSPEYVYWWLYASYQRSRATETGTAQPALSGERVRQIRIPLPGPDVQEELVRYFEQVQREFSGYRSLRKDISLALDALLPAILDKAFRGEL